MSTALTHSLRYLASDEAARSLAADPYWPKWDSPWWHMLLLHEMGMSDRIPRVAVQRMLEAIHRQYVPVFFSKEVPAGRDPVRDTFCHCALGTLYQVLSAAGADMDRELPWARDWFLRYQMPDGGFSCDEAAYHAHPPASSMVATIAPLEAVLYCTKRPFTSDEEKFLDAGARCLIARELRLGCSAPQNLEEKEDEADWLKPCFPRFYLYDVLRGLAFLARWAEMRRQILPQSAIREVVDTLERKFPDGQVRIERHAYEGIGTRLQTTAGEWTRSPEASGFGLLTEMSAIGRHSPPLTRQWQETRARISRLKQGGLNQ